MAASASAPAQTNDPSQTIYVKNLPEKLQKEELKRCLYELFSAYGRIMDIVALKTQKMRGQAFVVFREVASAAASLKALNGFMFFEKPMVIQYAKSKSNAVKREDGEFLIGTSAAART